MARESRSQIDSDQEQVKQLMALVQSGKSLQDALADLGIKSVVKDDTSISDKPRRELLTKSEQAKSKEKLKAARNKKFTDFKSSEERKAALDEYKNLIENNREKGYTPIITKDPDNPGQYMVTFKPHVFVNDEIAQDLRYNINMMRYAMDKEEKLKDKDKVQHSTDTAAMNAMYDFAMENAENPGYGELNFTMKVAPGDIKRNVARVAFSDERPTKLTVFDDLTNRTYPVSRKNYIEVEVPVNKQLRYLFDITDQLNGGDVENGGNVRYAADYISDTQDKSEKTQMIYNAMRNNQDFRPIYGDNGLNDLGSLFYTNPEVYQEQLAESRKAVASDILGIPRNEIRDDDIDILMKDPKYTSLFKNSVDSLMSKTDKAERGRPSKAWEDTDEYKTLSDKLKRNRSLLNTYVKDSDIRYGDNTSESPIFTRSDDDPYDLSRHNVLQSIYDKNKDISIPELISEFYDNVASGIDPDKPGSRVVSMLPILDALKESLGLERKAPDKVVKPNPNAPEPKKTDFYSVLNPMLKFIDIIDQNPKAADAIIKASGNNELLTSIRDVYNGDDLSGLKDILYLYTTDPAHWYNNINDAYNNAKKSFDYEQAKRRVQHGLSSDARSNFLRSDSALRKAARDQQALQNRLDKLSAIDPTQIEDIKRANFNSPEELQTAIDTIKDKLSKHGKYSLKDPVVQQKLKRAKELGMNDLVSEVYSNISDVDRLDQWDRIINADFKDKNGRMKSYNIKYDPVSRKLVAYAPNKGKVDEAIGIEKPSKPKKITLDVLKKKNNYNAIRAALDKFKTGTAAAKQDKEYELSPDQLTEEQKQRMIDRRRELQGEFVIGKGKSNDEVRREMDERKKKKQMRALKNKPYEVANTPTTDQDIMDVFNSEAVSVYDPYENEENNND